MRRGRLLPAFPFKKQLPLALAAVSLGALAYGLARGDGAILALGVLGLAATAFAFLLAPILIGRDEDDEAV